MSNAMDEKSIFKAARQLLRKKRAMALRCEHIGNIIGKRVSRSSCASKTNVARCEFGSTGEDRSSSTDLSPGESPANEITSYAGPKLFFDKACEDGRDERVMHSDLGVDFLPGACPADRINSNARLKCDFGKAGEHGGKEFVTPSDFSMSIVPGDHHVNEFTSDAEVHAGVAFRQAGSGPCAVIPPRSIVRRTMGKGVGRKLARYDIPHPRLYLTETFTDDDDSEAASLPPSFY
eukprot:TRINITY_DN59170_c0_g1_i1.p1 TRINITY_DN59170_c0_g1~~TRINITY_DN59170_c0_g1_i1.p1  ORF type:complete len:234 (-),score=33.33 TRINITY_DN59170_c0_g1_i1:220-921(-)